MECSIKGEKIQLMKNYKRAKFLYNFVLYSLASLIIFLIFSYPLWFSSTKYLFCSLPNMSFSSSPKFFFVMLNAIVFILLRESKLKPSSHSSPNSDIYDEYVARSSNSYHKVNSEEKIYGIMESSEGKRHGNVEKDQHHEEKKKVLRMCKSTTPDEEKKKELGACKTQVWGERENVKRENTKGEEDEQLYIPREELNKRVEAFIARVNKRRLLEAKLVDHSRG